MGPRSESPPSPQTTTFPIFRLLVTLLVSSSNPLKRDIYPPWQLEQEQTVALSSLWTFRLDKHPRGESSLSSLVMSYQSQSSRRNTSRDPLLTSYSPLGPLPTSARSAPARQGESCFPCCQSANADCGVTGKMGYQKDTSRASFIVLFLDSCAREEIS